MSAPKYLIDTNVFIPLEDAGAVPQEFAQLLQLAGKHGVGIYVHQAALDDISRDKDETRRRISLSKIGKFPQLAKVRGLDQKALEIDFGRLAKPNDVVDATLLHALRMGIADFLVTEDQGLHERAQKYARDIVGRVLYVADALSLLRSTYEPLTVSIPFVEEVDAHEIPFADGIFDSLRNGYPDFDEWWREKCIKQLRKCWVVVDEGRLAGLVVRKAEQGTDTDARTPGNKILKICTFKVRPERRGVKLGELLLKQVLWFAQTNSFDVAYVTTFAEQATLVELIEYYGFEYTYTKQNGELVYEKSFGSTALPKPEGQSYFEVARINYPRFYAGPEVISYGVPIKEHFHEILFPEVADHRQADLFDIGGGGGPRTPGNTIRKVYLCRAQARILQPGAILLFYKGKSAKPPSQAITTVGIFENMSLAKSAEDLRRMAGGRSVYSDVRLQAFRASEHRPVKVINFLLANHISPAIDLPELKTLGVFSGHPPQSIFRIGRPELVATLGRIGNFGFRIQ